jgi:hypothetical protein
MMMLGGTSEAKPAILEIQEIADKVSRCTSGKDVIPNQTSNIGFTSWPCVKSMGNDRNHEYMILFRHLYR